MARPEQIRKRAEFQRVYRYGSKAVGQFLVLFGLAIEGEGVRVGITATRKLGGAVVRNRCRRRVRELARRHVARLVTLGCVVVVNVRNGCSEAEWSLLEEDFLECVQKLETRVCRRGSQ